MELENTIQIKASPALLEVNFDALKSRLEQELERYKIVVTVDTVADAKKLATELNATRKIIDDRRKSEVAKASEPIKQFDEQMKELVLLCAHGRQKIIEQVTRFEDEVRDLCGNLLEDLRLSLWGKYSVYPEFQHAGIDDLQRLSNVTAKKNLTKAAKDELERRVFMDKQLQDQTERRLLKLQADSYAAGLKAPLERRHVESFLLSDEEFYEHELARLISMELKREEQAEERLRAQIEKEQARTQAVQSRIDPPAPQAQPCAPLPSDAPPRKTSPGKVAFTVTCTFVVEVSEAVKESDIATELKRVMQKAGIKNLSGVYVQRESGGA